MFSMISLPNLYRTARGPLAGVVAAFAFALFLPAEARGNSDGHVLINEFVASNQAGLQDEDGDYPDWIELCNPNEFSVNLTGWKLTDNSNDLNKWAFPPMVMPPNSYLVVFASEKDRSFSGSELHTNFKISRDGEYFALIDNASPAAIACEFDPEFPAQLTDISYGLSDDGTTYRYYHSPTPGAVNGGESFAAVLPPVAVNRRHGFYDAPFDVSLYITDPSAEIRYTLDGSVPGATNGMVYGTPINVTGGVTTLRAAGVRDDHLTSNPVTFTYLVNVDSTLKLLPALSLVTEESNLTGVTGIIGMSDQSRLTPGVNERCSNWGDFQNPPDVYYNPSLRGREWERPCSAEWIEPADNSGISVDCGIRVHGSDHSRPRNCVDSKFSYKLYFREDYGVSDLAYPVIERSTLPELDKLVVRAGLDDRVNPFVRDELARRLWADTGYPGVVGTFAHLFVNGDFKGYYNPCERPDQRYLQDYYGVDVEFDVIKQDRNVVDGDIEQWSKVFVAALPGSVTPEVVFDVIGELIDLENYIDYILLNIYAATWDWPDNNYIAYRERIPGTKFRFMVWDAEGTFGYDNHSLTYNTFFNDLRSIRDGEIAMIFAALKDDERFRALFQERVALHLFAEGGAYTDENIQARYDEIAAEMGMVVPNFDNLPDPSINDLGDDFSIGNTWIPGRREVVLQQLELFGLLGPTPTPTQTADETATPTPTFTSEPTATPVTTETPTPPSVSSGDLSGDGKVDAADLLLFLEQAHGSP